VSKLPIAVAKKHRRFGNVEGLYGRLIKMRQTVTALVRHERIELNYLRADEARGYAERLISDAVRYGDCHRPTMEQAKFWIDDPVLVPKLFKVLAPRYQSWSGSVPYTRLLRAPSNPTNIKEYESRARAVLELRGNPYPPLPGPMARKHPGQIHNVLLEEARKDYFKSQSTLSQRVETEILSLPDEDTSKLEEISSEEYSVEENKEMLSSNLEDVSLEDRASKFPEGKQ
jgi:large subunit ribosomal protein L17